MNRIAFIVLIGAWAAMLAFGTANAQAVGPGMTGHSYDPATAVSCQPLRDLLSSPRRDWNIERGMMNPGWPNSIGPGMIGVYPWNKPPYRQFAKPLGEKDALALVENYLDSTQNPNLKLGKNKDEETDYEFDVVTKDNSLVDRLLVNKVTGYIRSVY